MPQSPRRAADVRRDELEREARAVAERLRKELAPGILSEHPAFFERIDRPQTSRKAQR